MTTSYNLDFSGFQYKNQDIFKTGPIGNGPFGFDISVSAGTKGISASGTFVFAGFALSVQSATKAGASVPPGLAKLSEPATLCVV
jgi:hypothetical protein